MDVNKRHGHDDAEEKLPNEYESINQTNDEEASIEPKAIEINPTYISYQGYHELDSGQKEKELYSRSEKESGDPLLIEDYTGSKEPFDSRTERHKRRWLTPLITAILGGAVVLGSGSYFGFVDLTGFLPGGADGTVKSVETAVAKVDDKDGLQIDETAISSSDTIKMIEEVSPAVVGVVNIQKKSSNLYYNYGLPTSEEESSSSEEAGTGSGVIFKKEGDKAYIVTNNHVIEDADTIEVYLANEKKVEAKLIGTDALTDLAVLEISSEHVTKVAEFGDSDKLSVGQEVLAIGNPLGLDFSGSVTQGIISGLQRTVTVSTSAGEWDMDVIQTDAAINPGNSGGALVNLSGQVIGINSMKISSDGVEGIGFAIPSQEAKTIVNDLLADGSVQRAYVGVGLQSIAEIPKYVLEQQLKLPTDVTNGLVVTQVESGSPAAKAGIEAYDVIVSIEDTEVTTLSEFRKYLYSQTKSGDTVKIKLYRDGSVQTASVTLTEQ
ncbi:S1C family serine protease [Pradoshia sp.]